MVRLTAATTTATAMRAIWPKLKGIEGFRISTAGSIERRLTRRSPNAIKMPIAAAGWKSAKDPPARKAAHQAIDYMPNRHIIASVRIVTVNNVMQAGDTIDSERIITAAGFVPRTRRKRMSLMLA